MKFVKKRSSHSPTRPRTGKTCGQGKDLLPPTVYHLFGTLDVSPTYAVSREDLLEWIYAMESQPRPKNLFDELRQNYLLILGAQFSDWLPWFLSGYASRKGSPKPATGTNTSPTAEWPKIPDLVFLRHFSEQTKRHEGGAMKFVEELWTRWTKPPDTTGPASLPLPPERARAARSLSAMPAKTWMRRKSLKPGSTRPSSKSGSTRPNSREVTRSRSRSRTISTDAHFFFR